MKKPQGEYWLVKVLEENSKRYEQLPRAITRAKFSYVEPGAKRKFLSTQAQAASERKRA